MIGHVLYSDHHAGISLSSIDGMITSIDYYPSSEKEDRRCPKCSRSPKNADTPSLWLIGYQDVTFEEEKARLDRFAAALEENGSDLIGYVVGYRRCGTESDHVLVRAARAKQYLVITHRISSERIKIIDGGQRETSEIQLHVRERGTSPPDTSSFVYPDP
jgi:hypothetical protein